MQLSVHMGILADKRESDVANAKECRCLNAVKSEAILQFLVRLFGKQLLTLLYIIHRRLRNRDFVEVATYRRISACSQGKNGCGNVSACLAISLVVVWWWSC